MYDFKFLILEDTKNVMYILYLGKEYKLNKDSKLNSIVFAKNLDTMLGGITSLEPNEGLYKPIVTALIEVALWSYNNNIEVCVGQVEDNNSIGYRTLYNNFGESALEVFNWYLKLNDALFFALSTDRENISYSLLRTDNSHSKWSSNFDGLSSLPLPKAKASGTSWKYFKYHVFGSKSFDNHERGIKEMRFIDSNSVDIDDDIDRAYNDFMDKVDRDEGSYVEVQSNSSGVVDTGHFVEESDEVDINTVDFGDYSDVSIPDGVLEVYSVVALVSEETNKPIAIRCKTNFGFYDMNLATARSFGFKVSKLNKAIKVTYNDGIYSSASERRCHKFVDDISKNKSDCKRLIDVIMSN